MDAQAQSLHHVQIYAVKDQTDYSSLSHVPPPADQPVYSLLPTSSDYQTLKENFTIPTQKRLTLSKWQEINSTRCGQ